LLDTGSPEPWVKNADVKSFKSLEPGITPSYSPAKSSTFINEHVTKYMHYGGAMFTNGTASTDTLCLNENQNCFPSPF